MGSALGSFGDLWEWPSGLARWAIVLVAWAGGVDVPVRVGRWRAIGGIGERVEVEGGEERDDGDEEQRAVVAAGELAGAGDGHFAIVLSGVGSMMGQAGASADSAGGAMRQGMALRAPGVGRRRGERLL